MPRAVEALLWVGHTRSSRSADRARALSAGQELSTISPAPWAPARPAIRRLDAERGLRTCSAPPAKRDLPVRRWGSPQRRAHRVVAAVDVQDLAGDPARERARAGSSRRRRPGPRPRGPSQRRDRATSAGELVEARDAAGGERLDRARRDEVDADRAARGRARDSARRSRAPPWRRPSSRMPARRRGVEVEPDDRAAAASPSPRPAAAERRAAPSARTRSSGTPCRALGAGCRGSAAERVGRGERDRVQHPVERAPARAPASRARARDRRRVLTSSSSTSGRRRQLAAARSVSPPRPPEAREHHLGARAARARGDLEGDRMRVSTPVISSRLPLSTGSLRRAARSRRAPRPGAVARSARGATAPEPARGRPARPLLVADGPREVDERRPRRRPAAAR